MPPNDIYLRKVVYAATLFVRAAVQAATDFNQRQTALNLITIFQPHSLLSSELRKQSLDKIETVESELAAYNKYCSGFLLSLTENLLQAIAELPDGDRRPETLSLKETIERGIIEQSEFYQARESWVIETRKLISLMEQSGDKVELQGGEMVFNDHDLFAAFSLLCEEIDNIAALETEILQRRVGRFISAGMKLGLIQQ